LEDEPDLNTAGVADDLRESLPLALEKRPDLILIEFNGRPDFDAPTRIATWLPEIRLIILSDLAYDRYIQEALDLGAVAYVTKHEPLDALVSAVRIVARGGRYFSSDVARRLVPGPNGARSGPSLRTRASTLTARELEILQHIAHGMARKTIAERLTLSVKTIDCHCANLMAKLEIYDRVQLTRFALRERIAPL
jgi:DNA-binding NarL/FixJ family response regulator